MTPALATNAYMIQPRRPTAWAVRLGFFLGRGHSSVEVARLLDDGTHPATVRDMAKKAELRPDIPRQVVVPVMLWSWQRDAVAAKAAELGIEPSVLVARVLESAVVLDDLYDAITDGRYDNDNRL